MSRFAVVYVGILAIVLCVSNVFALDVIVRNEELSLEQQRLWDAAISDNPENVLRCLNEGVDVNTRFEMTRFRATRYSSTDRVDQGSTMLMVAGKHSPNADVVRTLIASGADVNARDSNGLNALMHAMYRTQRDSVIQQLVDHGVEVNARDKRGQSVLMYACASGQDTEVLRLLIQHGADTQAKDAEGRTVLMYAIRRAEEDGAIDLLIRHGADVHERDQYGRSLIMHAAMETRSPSVIDLLVRLGSDVNETLSNEAFRRLPRGYGNTVLSHACVRNPNPDVFQALLRHGADINAPVKQLRYHHGERELPQVVVFESSHLYLIASRSSSPEILDAAIDAGATVVRIGSVDQPVPLEAARRNSSMKDTDAFWRLNDLSYD